MMSLTNKVQQLLLSFLYRLLFVPCSYFSTAVSNHPLLLIISYDGLRYDFMNETRTPTLYKLAQEGVWARKGILSQVDTVTMPNHHCIVTGLYQESHGLVGNTFYDPVLKAKYDIWNFTNDSYVVQHSLDGFWYPDEPIWLTNQNSYDGSRSKPDRRCSGSQKWPAGNAHILGQSPCEVNAWADYGNFSTWPQEIDELLDWFTRAEKPINFGLYYNGQPDHFEHYHDIYSPETKDAIAELDNLTSYLIEESRKRGILDRLNLIITADHGHVNIVGSNDSSSPDYKNVVFLEEVEPEVFANLTDFVWSEHAFFINTTKPGFSVEEVYVKLKSAIERKGLLLDIWLKKDLPEKYHYKNNPRVGDIILLPRPPAYFYYNRTRDQIFKKGVVFGGHGFLNEVDGMRPLFLAHGPSFKKGFATDRTDIENVDLYPLMCAVLGILPKPNNGSIDRILDFLTDDVREAFLAATRVSLLTSFNELMSEYRVSVVILLAIVLPSVCFTFYLFTQCMAVSSRGPGRVPRNPGTNGGRRHKDASKNGYDLLTNDTGNGSGQFSTRPKQTAYSHNFNGGPAQKSLPLLEESSEDDRL